MKTHYLNECICLAFTALDNIEQFTDKHKADTPAPGAPADDYMITIGAEYYKAADDIVARAANVDAIRAKEALGVGVAYFCIAPGNKDITDMEEGEGRLFATILIDSEYIQAAKNGTTDQVLRCLVEELGYMAAYLGASACEGALIAAERGGEYKAPRNAAWYLIATIIRLYNALTQGKPVNIPDICDALQTLRQTIAYAARALLSRVYAAIDNPDNAASEDALAECASSCAHMTGLAAALLACCGVPGVTVDGGTLLATYKIPNEYNVPREYDFSTAEIAYLVRKAQGSANLKDKCAIVCKDATATPYAQVKAITEYLTAVKNSL